MPTKQGHIGSFLYTSITDAKISILTFLAMCIPAISYSIMFDDTFIIRFSIIILMGCLVEFSYNILNRGKLKLPRVSTAITAGLLALSIPLNVPYMYVFGAIIVSLLLVKLPSTDYSGMILNPMLVGRLFLFIFCGEMIMDWTPSGDIDGLTAATPLALYAEEGFSVPFMTFVTGAFNSNWEEMYMIVPGSPGEILPLLTLITGVGLVILKVIDWRLPLAFLVTSAVGFLVIGTPVLFGMFSGGIIFTAVFIATMPTTTPIEPKARIIAGILAGVINCAIRSLTYYPEAVMFSFLIINILSPTIDRIMFYFKSRRLNKMV